MIGGLIGSIRRIGIFGGSGVEVEVEVESGCPCADESRPVVSFISRRLLGM